MIITLLVSVITLRMTFLFERRYMESSSCGVSMYGLGDVVRYSNRPPGTGRR